MGRGAATGVFARGRVAAAIHGVLKAADALSSAVVVDGDPALARVVAGHGWTVSTVAVGRAARRAPRPIDALPAQRTCSAVIGVGEVTADQVAAWAAACVDGGIVVLVDWGPASAAPAAALLAGLTDLEQRDVRRAHLTSGRVVAWAVEAG